MQPSIAQRLPEIKQLLRHYGVEQAYLFGSAVRNTMQDDGDVDVVIRFPEHMSHADYAKNYFAMADALEALLQKKVDLVTERTIKNPYLLQTINQHKVPLL